MSRNPISQRALSLLLSLSLVFSIFGMDTTAAWAAGNGSNALGAPGAAVNLTLVGTNALKSGFDCAGLEVPGDTTDPTQNASLTIKEQSTGSLTATSERLGAGIGGGYIGDSGGIIKISGGSVTTTGGAGESNISGGTKVSMFEHDRTKW